METTPPLNLCHVQKSTTIINRSHILIHFLALLALFHYRISYLFQKSNNIDIPILIWILIFSSELMLSFLWLLNQAFQWRPVLRTTFPENLPENENSLPSIDVFICTADADKEPIMEVMNTVLSAMALDYPPEKLSVYLSDDSGSSSILYALKEAFGFARWWLPFCKSYGIKTRCPGAYFLNHDDGFGDLHGTKFVAERDKVKEKYEVLKESVKKGIDNGGIANTSISTNRDHPPFVEIVDDKLIDIGCIDTAKMPLLVYVSREKRPSQPHHFKAGALNALLRVSGVISNSPYILVLDCDMYCNDPSSAKKAMCFHLDSKMSASLAFVQFPQRFYNIAKSDIYDSQLRSIFTTQWEGMDGLLGPGLSGTCFYIKRVALYGSSILLKDTDIMERKQIFGTSNDFIKSLDQNNSNSIHITRFSLNIKEEIQLITSCNYEHQTQWGEEVGFLYYSVVEDYFTGLYLHCKGWTSVFCDPPRPQFLGSATTILNDILVQQTRWYSGLIEVGFSWFCPLFYGSMRMSVLQSMCYAELALLPLHCLPFWCLATIPQLCLLNGIPLYPEAFGPFFIIFPFIFVSSVLKHLHEVINARGTFQTWSNEQRMWMIKSTTSYFHGTLDALMNKFGIKDANFIPTNKAINNELYEMGKIDFQTSKIFIVPLVFLVVLNAICFVVGLVRALVIKGDFDKLLLQLCLSFYGLIMSYPVIEGVILRNDRGSISTKVTVLSTVFSAMFLILGSILLSF